MLWNEVNLVWVIYLNMRLKKSILDLTWCTPYIPMKQTLFEQCFWWRKFPQTFFFIANVLSSNCGMYFFLNQIWVCVYFSWWYPAIPPLPPPDQKAIQATGKLIQEITKALVVNTLGPYIWLISKSAAFDPPTLELLPLYRAAKKKKLQVWEDSITAVQVNL